MNPHLALPPVTVGPALEVARRFAVVLRARDQDPAYMVARLDAPDVAYVLPVVGGSTWYPGRFFETREANEPWLTSARDALEAAGARVELRVADDRERWIREEAVAGVGAMLG